MTTFDPDWVVAPGETLKDWFDEMDVPLLSAIEQGIPEDVLSGILDGNEPITEEIAEKLFSLTGVSAAFWIALERNYQDGLAAGKERT